ncbi:hypothetical protein BLNAU_8435 [Blattamonas nauphoetae]|uniref:Uncharacterized protein n=1 Tax=Blattamonas nauphoetae TaxID=2049346 RepID=A0ABQ9XYM8_9EUKA|nr:hypothetical protein BLNAU_8435 [Blattamonas nauphoetae]
MESLFFEPEIVDSLFLEHEDLIISTFKTVGTSSPPSAVLTTLARISLFPHLRIAHNSLSALYRVMKQDPRAFTLLPSPIFPPSSPYQQYFGLSFQAALTKRLRTVFSEFQTSLPTDPSHLPTYVQMTKDDPFKVTRSLNFCSYSFLIVPHLLGATPPIEIAPKIIRDFILFVKEALTTILTNISKVDRLIASLSSDSPPITQLVSNGDTEMTASLELLRNKISDPHKSSFQTTLLDDSSFPDLILNSLKLTGTEIGRHTVISISNIIVEFRFMKEKVMIENLVGRMFETVDFVSLPLSGSKTLFSLTKFIQRMSEPIGEDGEPHFEQYPLIRIYVFEPAKQFVKFMFRNSGKLVLNDKDKAELEALLCQIHRHVTKMELRSDEHDADFVSELVKWEIRQMVEMENDKSFTFFFQGMVYRSQEWNRDQHERQKRREVIWREYGWDDVFELRMMGMGVDTNQTVQRSVRRLMIELTLNADEI